jgi:peptidoglycan/LPS O-acetylase OafA/YrhL
MIAMTAFVSNVFFKRDAGAGGYFDRISDSQALLHPWSLSVEEQFYFLFPAALLLLVRWARGRSAQRLFLVAIASLIVSIWTTQYRPLSAFYILIPRAWELLMGALLAMKAAPSLVSRMSREIAGMLGLGCITWTVLTFTKDTTFPGLSALLPCLGCRARPVLLSSTALALRIRWLRHFCCAMSSISRAS